MQIQLATVTQKGQVTIPYEMRNYLGIKPYSKVKLSILNQSLKLESTSNILDFAPIGIAPKGMNALKAREYMAKHYKRV